MSVPQAHRRNGKEPTLGCEAAKIATPPTSSTRTGSREKISGRCLCSLMRTCGRTDTSVIAASFILRRRQRTTVVCSHRAAWNGFERLPAMFKSFPHSKKSKVEKEPRMHCGWKMFSTSWTKHTVVCFEKKKCKCKCVCVSNMMPGF